MNFTELDIRKRLLREWKNRVPTIHVNLVRPVYSLSAAGGRVETDRYLLGPQEFGFMPFKRRLTIEVARQARGYGDSIVEDITYVLIAVPEDVDIQKNDYFDWEDETIFAAGRYLVSFVQARRHDHLQAGIRYLGDSAKIPDPGPL